MCTHAALPAYAALVRVRAKVTNKTAARGERIGFGFVVPVKWRRCRPIVGRSELSIHRCLAEGLDASQLGLDECLLAARAALK